MRAQAVKHFSGFIPWPSKLIAAGNNQEWRIAKDAAPTSKFPRDGQIKSMVESRRETNPTEHIDGAIQRPLRSTLVSKE